MVWLWTMSHQVVLMGIGFEKCIPRLLLQRVNLLVHLFRVCRQLNKCTCNLEKRRASKQLSSHSTSLRHSGVQLSQLVSSSSESIHIEIFLLFKFKINIWKTIMKHSCYLLPLLVSFVLMFLRSGSTEDVPLTEGEWVHFILELYNKFYNVYKTSFANDQSKILVVN